MVAAGNIFRRNGINHPSVEPGVNGRQIEEIFVAGFRGFMHLDRISI